MLDLTVIILTKDEEVNIKKCIDSFGEIVKKFVVVDSFSKDKTKQVLMNLRKKNELNINFFERDFKNQAEQFNWAISNCQIDSEWVMRIDADEELTSQLREEMMEKLPVLKKDVNGVVLKRRTYFLGKWIKHGGKYPDYQLRIFRIGKGRSESKIMDEHIVVDSGIIETFKFDFIDRNMKSLEWWTDKHNAYSTRELVNYANLKKFNAISETQKLDKHSRIKRLFKDQGYYKVPIFLRAHLYYIYRYYLKMGFLDGKEGKIYHFLQAYWYRFLVDAKIFENRRFK